MQITELPLFVSPIELPEHFETRYFEPEPGHGHIIVWDHICHVEIDTTEMSPLEVVRSIRFAITQLLSARTERSRKRRLN